jgi:hypothetical protein
MMQGALCLVLAMALGVAALVSRRSAARRVEFADTEETIDGLTMFRPRGWSLQRDEDGLVMDEVGPQIASPRRLSIRHKRSAIFASPWEHLVRRRDIDENEKAPTKVKPMSIGGWPAMMISQTRTSGAEIRKRIHGCALLDSDLIVLRLDGSGAAEPGDEDLLRQFAEKLKLADRPEVKSGGEIQLRDGIHVRVPERFVHAQASDPLRVARRLVYSNTSTWLGVDLTPCVVRPGEEAEQLQAMMQLRDPQFRLKRLRKVGDQTWVCEHQDSGRSPATVALRVTADGQGLLIEFRWESTDEKNSDAVNALKQSMLDSVQFGQVNLQALIDRGIEARKALPADLSDEATESWEWVDEISSRTSFLDRKTTTSGKTAIADPPANFVAGGLLTRALGHLPLEPMILTTDWLPGMANVSPRPMLLRLEPAFDLPRTLPGSSDPMRCWSVSLNGSGESSRWYLDDTGRVQVVAFAGKVLLQRNQP